MIIKTDDIAQNPNAYKAINFSEIIEDINPEKPVVATLSLEKTSDYILVKGNVTGTLILECVRCLKKDEKEITVDIDEVISLANETYEAHQEVEIKDNAFYITLENKDIFDVTDFLYQTLILYSPNYYVCGINCKGEDDILEKYSKEEENDPRLEVFKNIKLEKE